MFMPGDGTASSPCHWWRRFRASGAARWRRGCWTAWRGAARRNQVQTEQIKTWERPSDAPGAASFTARDAVGHPLLAGSVLPPFSAQETEHTAEPVRIPPEDGCVSAVQMFQFKRPRGETTQTTSTSTFPTLQSSGISP